MSTKMTLKYVEPKDGKPGAHLYEDIYECSEDEVVLSLENVTASLTACANTGATVAVVIPRDLARKLGLLEAKP